MHSIIKITTTLLIAAQLSACGGGSSEENTTPIDNVVVEPSQETYNKDSLAKITFIPNSSTLIELGGEVSSEAITLDIMGEENISIENGVYSIDGGDFTSLEGVVKNGTVLVIKQALPESYEISITTTVTIGTTTLSFTHSTGEAPDGYVQVPEGAISVNYTCLPSPSACNTAYTKANFYDSSNNLIKQADLVREVTSFAETETDKSTIALFKPHETDQRAVVFLSLDNQHYNYDALRGSYNRNHSIYGTDECKSYSVILDGLNGYDIYPSYRLSQSSQASFDIVEYDENTGIATVSLITCGDEGVRISEKKNGAYSSAVSYVDLPIGEIVEGDVISLTMESPTLITTQFETPGLTSFSFISFNEDNTAYNVSSGYVGEYHGDDDFYLYPSPNAHYVASILFDDLVDHQDTKSQFYNFSELPENNIFSKEIFDIEIETVAFDPETLSFNYSVSGNDTPSIVRFDLRITYEVVIDGVAKAYNTTSSVFSQHSTTPISFPNVHGDFTPENAEVTKISGKLVAIKTTYFDSLNSAMDFGINSSIYSPGGFSSDNGASGFYTSEYFVFFERD